MPDEKTEPKPSDDPGPIKTGPVKKAPPPPETKKVADPGRLRTVSVREARRPSGDR
jgi:hypothetical protein